MAAQSDRIHQGPRAAAIDMRGMRYGGQEAGKIRRPPLLFVDVQVDLVVVLRQAPKVGCPGARAHAVKKAPALASGRTGFDHAHDRCDANASSDEDMLFGFGMEPEQGPRRTDLNSIASAQSFVHMPGAAARIMSKAYPEAISLLLVRSVGEGVLPAQATRQMHIHV